MPRGFSDVVDWSALLIDLWRHLDGSCPSWVDAVEKISWGNLLKLLMRFVRSDVRDHIASQKNDHGPSYRH
jgi:hypothetical protein